MRHICHKLLPGIIQDLHTLQQFIKYIGDHLCFRIVRNGDFFIQIAIGQLLNSLTYSGKRFHQDFGYDETQEDHQDTDDQHKKISSVCHDFHSVLYLGNGSADQHYTVNLLRFLICQRDRLLYISILLIIVAGVYPFKALDHFFGKSIFSFVDVIGIFYDPSISVYDQYSGTVD